MHRTLFSPEGPPDPVLLNENRECPSETTWVPDGFIHDAIHLLNHGRAEAALGVLWGALEDHAEDAPCGWEGDVEVAVEGRHRRTAFWACPRCGTEHEKAVENDDEGERL